MSKIEQKIEEIENELNPDSPDKRQEFISFRNKEFGVFVEAYKLLGKSKSRTIAIACKLLLENLKKDEQ